MVYNTVMNKQEITPGSFISQMRAELKKVTWPTRAQAAQLTATVFIISLIVALYVGIIDFLMAKVLEFLAQK